MYILNYKSISWKFLLLVHTALCINNALADDGNLSFRAGVGKVKYSLPWASNYDLKSNYTHYMIGTSYLMDGETLGLVDSKLFFDLSMKKSGSNAVFNSQDFGNGNPGGLPFNRTEFSLVIGQVNNDGFRIFLELMSNKTEEDNLKLTAPGPAIDTFKETQSSTGISAGVGQEFPIQEGAGGTISVKGSLGYKSAKWDEEDKTNSVNSGTYNANAKGFNVGVGYNYSFSKSVKMLFDWDYQSYKFDYTLVSKTEKVSSLTAALQAQF